MFQVFFILIIRIAYSPTATIQALTLCLPKIMRDIEASD